MYTTPRATAVAIHYVSTRATLQHSTTPTKKHQMEEVDENQEDLDWFGPLCHWSPEYSRSFPPSILKPDDRSYEGKPSCGTIRGWLLFGDFADNDRPFFFHPSTHERVDLPLWPNNMQKPKRDAVISCVPSDPGCKVVFLLWKTIVFCKVSHREWSSCESETGFNGCSAAFCDGQLYIVDQNQRLGVVRLKNRRANAVRWVVLDTSLLPPRKYRWQFLVESSGVLLLVFFRLLKRCYVFEADLKRNQWMPRYSLAQDQSLFLAPGGSVSVEAERFGWEAGRIFVALRSGDRSWSVVQSVAAIPGENPTWLETDQRGRIIYRGKARRWLFP